MSVEIKSFDAAVAPINNLKTEVSQEVDSLNSQQKRSESEPETSYLQTAEKVDKKSVQLSLIDQLHLDHRQEKIDRILEAAKKDGFSPGEISALTKALENCPINLFIANEFNKELIADKLKNQIVKQFEIELTTSGIHSNSTCNKLGKLCDKLEKFNFQVITLPPFNPQESELLHGLYDQGESIDPYLLNFDTNVAHTLFVDKYLDVRIARIITKTIHIFNQSGKNTELFIGSETNLKKYYQMLGYKNIVQLGTNNSNHYFVLEHPDPTNNKLVIAGLGSSSRFNNVLLQLKYCDVDLEKSVQVHGTFTDALQSNNTELSSVLGSFKIPPKMAFIGNRSQVLIELAKHLYPKEMDGLTTEKLEPTAEKLLSERNNLETKEIGGVYKFSYVKVKMGDEEHGIIGFRMPNGSLSYSATQILLESGVTDLILVGAGGSMQSAIGMGSYQVIHSSTYQENTIELPKEKILSVEIPGLQAVPGCTNITVDSPLEENKVWTSNVSSKGISSVDVETYHIFKAIRETEAEIRFLLPGLFISDVVGSHPLEEKISLANAYPKLPNLIQACFKKVDVKVL